MRPYLLKEAVSPDGTVLYRTSPKVVSTPISEETSLTMRKLLEDVVAIGGAKMPAFPGLPHRRQNGHGAGLQGRPHRAERSHRFVSGLCPGG